MSERVLLGRISEAHGLRGEVKIASFTAIASDIAGYGALAGADGTSTYVITSYRVVKPGQIIARLDGVTTREAAEKLAGTELYVQRDAMPEPNRDEFYHADLIGIAAVTPAGNALGEVIAVHNYGAGDLLELRLMPSRETEFIPFDAVNVPEVDMGLRRVIIAYDFTAAEDDKPS